MQRESILFGIIGLLAGSLITIVVVSTAVNNNMTEMMQMMGIRPDRLMMRNSLSNEDHLTDMGMGSSMTEMMLSLEGNSEEVDQKFLSAMIIHHQGALEMARKVQGSTQRAELKKLADDIISAQTNEIGQMRQWQKEWFD
ncbi:MAG: hypothetical protein UW73_C0012G0010 [Microgenomates group bacterium GW2011_GWB1_44_8]|nr:MAG: hypothetical protein UW73_C0012G0010 [Microgenomates group bacterium GW2011_GWB1_44_8]